MGGGGGGSDGGGKFAKVGVGEGVLARAAMAITPAKAAMAAVAGSGTRI